MGDKIGEAARGVEWWHWRGGSGDHGGDRGGDRGGGRGGGRGGSGEALKLGTVELAGVVLWLPSLTSSDAPKKPNVNASPFAPTVLALSEMCHIATPNYL
ncbi:hypothetical protein BBO_02196 [Beauveria brongniartii RCEF 3172]|uniref:Uncharacterized protein n=1 Tax=Beauveria brongniartii RCEF 3172 TaxID=1081107 RepID=A0A167IJ22_9HYPO|nr:hypothetical protein BBO_02196 [Beauveria brongniartii RCEF 3172]